MKENSVATQMLHARNRSAGDTVVNRGSTTGAISEAFV
jgi:hypothetical protein